MEVHARSIITLTLNPSIDQTFHIDSFSLSSVNNCDSFAQIAAGKGINVTKYLNQLGCFSKIFAPMCSNAQPLFLEQLSLFNPYFFMVKGTIRTNATIICPLQPGATHIKCKGEFSFKAEEQREFFKVLKKVLKNGDFLLVCGSYPLEFNWEDFNVFLKEIIKDNIQVMIDNDGFGLKRLKDPFNYFLKPNLGELQEFVADKIIDLKSLIEFLIKDFFGKKREILVTLGDEGIVYCGAEGVFHCILKAEKIISTVGCGDAVLAGWVYGKVNGVGIEECLKWAISCAVCKLGNGVVGYLDRENVLSLQENVKIVKYL